MRALTVRQPWAWAIIHSGKDVENRTQAWSYRGPVAIHAGVRWSDRGGESDAIARAWAIERRIKPEWGDKCYPLPREDLFPTSAFVGVVDLVDVHHVSALNSGEILCCDSPWAEHQYDPRHGGLRRRNLVHLELANPRPFVKPIPARGRLGLWTPSPEQLLAIVERIGHAA